MDANASFPALILAAGASRRMGFPKLLLAHDGVPVLREINRRLHRSGWGGTGVIISDEGLESFVRDWLPDAALLFNPRPERGMISSIRLGLEWAGDEAAGLLTFPVDYPLVGCETLQSIRSAAAADRVVIPVYQNRRGHPTWWGRSCWEFLYSDIADHGAREALRLPGINVIEETVSDDGVLHNINTQEDAVRFNLERYCDEDG